jgi:hypothetical protein
MEIAAAAVPAIIGGIMGSNANDEAAKVAAQQLAYQKQVQGQLFNLADPYNKGSLASYGTLANAMGVNGQAGMQSYLTNSINPLLAGAQGNALDAMNQKYAAMGYGPVSGNQMAAGNNLLQGMYLGQYNTQVGQLSNAAAQQGGLATNLYGAGANVAGASNQPASQLAQYTGQAGAQMGAGISQGLGAALGSPQGKSMLGSVGTSIGNLFA